MSDEEDDDFCFVNICGFDENIEFINWEEIIVFSLESEIENSSVILFLLVECEDDRESDDGDSLFYDGVRLIVVESFLFIMIFVVSYNLIGEVFGSLFFLLNLYCL